MARRASTATCSSSALLLCAGTLLFLLRYLYAAPPPRVTCPAWFSSQYPTPASADELERALSPRHFPAKAFFDLIIFVPTGAAWRHRREPLRLQYERTRALLPPHVQTKLFFVVGERAEGVESSPDILRVPCLDLDGEDGLDQPTSSSATSCKVLKSMRYIHKTFDYHFLARVGDDAYFRFDLFFSRIAAKHVDTPLAFAFFMTGNKIVSDAQRLAYRTYYYPSYAGGMTYIFGHKLVHTLVRNDEEIGLLDGWPEDGMTGFWLAGLKYERVNSPCFHNNALPVATPKDAFLVRPGRVFYEYLAAPCSPESLVVHYMTPALWSTIDSRGLLHCGSMPEGSYGIPVEEFWE
jgi:Galactosyltransferase